VKIHYNHTFAAALTPRSGLWLVTRWSGSGGIEAYLSGQLVLLSAMMLLVGSSDL